MKVSSTDEPITTIQTDAVIVGIHNRQPLTGAAREVDLAMGGRLSRLIENGHISAEEFAISEILAPPEIQATAVLVVGLGDLSSADNSLPFRAAAAAAKKLASVQRSQVAFFLDDLVTPSAIAGGLVGCVGQDLYRREQCLYPFAASVWAKADDKTIQQGVILGESINLTRRLVNEPASEIYPETLAEQCVTRGKESGFEVEVWDENRLRRERCEALLAVAQASDRPPRFVKLTYRGRDDDAIPLALVGKGVTFDSGGLSLKSNESMIDMKCDMAGAATVLGAIDAIARSR